MENFKQYDTRWADGKYNAKSGETGKTIKSSGCGATAIADFFGGSIDPLCIASWLANNGYKAPNQGTSYDGISKAISHFGGSSIRLNFKNNYGTMNLASSMISYLQCGCKLICCMGKGHWTNSGHFVVVDRIEEVLDNSIFIILDPASDSPARARSDIYTFVKEVKYCWAVEPIKETEYTKEMWLDELKNIGETTLKKGCKGAHVYHLQKRLLMLGYILQLDGKFGAETELTVRQFQTDHGKNVDGVVTKGQISWKRLKDL